MKFIILLMCFLSFICSCNNNVEHADKNKSGEKFDKVKWAIQYDDDYPHRDEMLGDLIANQKLKGLKKIEVLHLLGQPDRIDSNYLFYKVAQKRIGLLPLHTKTLVIKLANDTVEWRKIHE